MAKRILAVDDEEANLEMVTDAVKPLGFECLRTSGGEEALKIAKQSKPDLIILDVAMPRMDGFTVLTKLAEEDETRNIPVIMLTGKSQTKDLFLQYKAVRQFLEKPFRIKDLVAAVKQVLPEA